MPRVRLACTAGGAMGNTGQERTSLPAGEEDEFPAFGSPGALRLALAINPHISPAGAGRGILERLILYDGNRYVRAAARARLADPDWRLTPDDL